MATTLGLTTVEVLLALVIFAVGALGAAGGLATGLRATAMGSHQAEAARAGVAALGELVVAARRGAAACAGLPAPSRGGPGGELAMTALAPQPGGGGVTVQLVLRYQGPAGLRTDTLRSFLRCQ